MVQAPAACNAGERYTFDVFDHERGLGNSTVTRLARDHLGALWVGTENGLYRYDGYRFLAFTTAEGLPGNKITAIHESPDGTLWVGTLEGLAWREGAGFHKSSNAALKGYITPQGIASDGTGRVFIATLKGVAVTFPPTPGGDVQVTFLPWPAAVPKARSSNVYVTSPDEVWFDCDVAICRWNGKEVRVWDSNAGVPPHKWDFFLKDRSGNLWARNRDSFIELPSGMDRFQPVGPDLPGPISFPPELTMDSNGRILVTDNRGLAIGGPGSWRRITEKQGLPASIVTAVTQDAEGSIWLGTYGAGLARWAGYDTSSSFTAMEGLAGSSILSLLEDPPSGMWAGTAAGLSHGVYSKGRWEWSEVSVPGVGLAASLARAADGALWMVTDGHFVVRYDPGSHTSRRLGPFEAGPFDLRADSAGRLWIADAGSVAVAGSRSRMQDLERMRPTGATESTLFTTTLEDTRGDLWFGSMSGLFRRSLDRWFHYDTSNGLRSNRIVDLALSPEGDVWATYAEPKGTDRVHVVGDRVQVENFDRSKGLTSDRVNSVGFDRQGQLWVLNDHGAEVRRGNRWVQYSRADGLITSGSAGRAFCASADGAIWIGSERGLSRFLPAQIAEAPPEPPGVRFSEVRIGNKTVDPALTSFVEATPQTFEARYSALLLGHASDVQYRYRISGFDDRWQETAQPNARFDYPRPGRYRLEVQARNVGQPWSGPTATLVLEVRPHWYETILFRGVLLALFCFALWLLEKYRQRRSAAARQALKQMVDERTAQLRESEERFRTMADNAPVMIWVAGADKLFTFFNKTWLDFTGRTIEQELGSGWAACIHPEDLQRSYEVFSSAFDARRDFHLECRLRRADGEYRSILCSGVPRFAPGGIFAGYIGTDIDITDLQSEERFRQLAENIDQVFWMLDLGTNQMLYVSSAFEKVWGRSATMLYQSGDWLSETVHAEDRERRIRFLTKIRSEPAEEVYRIIRPDGSVRWIHDRGFLVYDPEGTPYRVAGIAEDITTHHDLEEQLRQAHKMEAVGRLAGGIAHDFNNLLMIIGGYSRMVLDDHSVEQTTRDRLEQILNAANRGSILTRQLLAFSRRQVLQPSLVNLNHLLTNMKTLLGRLIGEHITIETELDPAVSCIKADPHQIEQVVMNLAANARDAMPNGGRFRIQTAMAASAEAQHGGGANGIGKYVRLRISDTGCGMDDHTRERAFEPFFTTKGLGKGTGLGLSTVYGIVCQNQGEIHITSEPGRGAAFDLYFPAVAEREVRSEAPPNQSPKVAATETILVVEDEPAVRMLVKQTLQQLGYTVLEATDGYEALRVIEQHASEIDLLLTDVIMPLMNGRELATRLKAIRPGTKVLYMSGYTDDVLAFHGLSQPEIDFIQKPFTPSELAEKVETVLLADKGNR
jgi:two-component system cell cycle sensor histidine kinase/response regulator CckA